MKMRGAKIVVECLLEQGVDTVFGYPGGTILNIYDELYQYRDRISHVLTAHEQGAAHAADGYARTTGRVGVCMATSGPGATNLTTGIATAYMDSSPVVFITCNVGESLIGKDSFQEVDIIGISMPITKCNYLVRDPAKIADVMREAFAIAAGGRPGPVLIDIPKNITVAEAEYTPLPGERHEEHGLLSRLVHRAAHGFRVAEPNHDDINILLELIKQSKRPMIMAGGGVIRSDASAELIEFAEKLDAPVTNTIMGLGGFPGEHPLYMGMIGMHGTRQSNLASDACDLLIAIGARFSDRVIGNADTFAKKADIVHIDIDRAEIDKNIITDHHIIGDAKKVLSMLNEKLGQYSHPEWRQEVASFAKPANGREKGVMDPQEILESVYDATSGDAIIVTDVGQHQMWSAQYFKYKRPRQLVTSGGYGTMGFGLGAAIGAKTGNPDKIVIHATGDGSFRMNCNELATVNYYELPIITVIFNNGTLGMVRQWQSLLYGNRYSQTTLDRAPDFMKLAEAYGINGYRAETIEQFRAAIDRAIASGKAAIIECIVDIDEMVRPMVPAGNPLTDFIFE